LCACSVSLACIVDQKSFPSAWLLLFCNTTECDPFNYQVFSIGKLFGRGFVWKMMRETGPKTEKLSIFKLKECFFPRAKGTTKKFSNQTALDGRRHLITKFQNLTIRQD
jgi:hypothetical protein